MTTQHLRNDGANAGLPVKLPDLLPVIQWLEADCDPKLAANELRLYRTTIVDAQAMIATLRAELDALKSAQAAIGGEARDAAWVEIPTLTDVPPYASSTMGRSDPLYKTACEVVRASKRGSISLVQRHLRIGYNRASGLLEAMVGDVLEEMPPTTKIIKLRAAMAPDKGATE